ncbi:hypothetical protein D3C85_1462890 [compost metagenome]
MALVQFVIIQDAAEALTKVVVQEAARSESLVNSANLITAKAFDPNCVVKCLGNHLAGCAVTLEFNQH